MNEIIQLAILPMGMVNCFLIKGEHTHILVDTGTPHSETKILRQLEAKGISIKDISLIIVTHGHIDHFGSAKVLKDMLNVPILMHELDKKALETGRALLETLKPTHFIWNLLKIKAAGERAQTCEPDIILKEKETFSLKAFGIDGEVVNTPGHTPGSLSVLLEDGNALIMDLVSSGIFMGGIAFRSRIKHPPFHDNMEEVKNSIIYLLSTHAHKFYLGHGYPISRKGLITYRDNFFNN